MISYTIDPPIFHKLAHLEQRLVETYAHLIALDPAEQGAIQRFARISTIGATTRIENALLTDSEVEWLDTVLTQDGHASAFEAHKEQIEDKLSKDRERSIEEVAGCRSMLELIFSQASGLFPLTETTIRALHHELMRYYSKPGFPKGQYKTAPNSVVEYNRETRHTRDVFRTADPGPITETAMQSLIAWYNSTLPIEPYSVPVLCEFVFRFLAIHPFQDGNGRMGRGLFLLGMLQSHNLALRHVAPYLALDRHIEQHKSEYYAALNRCSNGQYQADAAQYHLEHFLLFMLKIFEGALSDIAVYRARFTAIQRLSDAGSKVFAAFKEFPELRLTTKLLIEQTGIPRRTLIHNLNILLAHKLIQRYGQGAATRYQLTF